MIGVTGISTAAIAVYAWHTAGNTGHVRRVAGGAIFGGAAANLIDRASDGVVSRLPTPAPLVHWRPR